MPGNVSTTNSAILLPQLLQHNCANARQDQVKDRSAQVGPHIDLSMNTMRVGRLMRTR